MKTATEQEEDVFPFEQKTVDILGRSFTFRELSVQENDDCADAARGPDNMINGRTMVRLMMIASSVDPKLTPKNLAALPQRVYAKLYDTVNALNDPESLEKPEDESGVAVEDEAGNG